MRVTITGATGTIGRGVTAELRERGDEVTALSRDARRASESLGVEAQEWTEPKAEQPPLDSLRGRDGVLHLLGETVAQRWSDDVKREIRDSRILATRNLVAALEELPGPPPGHVDLAGLAAVVAHQGQPCSRAARTASRTDSATWSWTSGWNTLGMT